MDTLATCTLSLTRGSPRTFYFRPDSVGDQGVIAQIFQHRHYELTGFHMAQRLHKYALHHRRSHRLLVVDGGANIGAASVYFAFQYPGCKIIAVEPEKHNCRLLRRNCKGLHVTLLQNALGCEAGKLYLFDPGHSDWGFRTGKKGDSPVDAVTMNDILQKYCSHDVIPFICKLDIEGGEQNLFRRNYGWLAKFPLLIIELHDWLLPGEGNSRNFLKALSHFDFDFTYRGENAFCFNNAILNAYK
jgi:FkbM family methyltransferase